MPDYKDSKIYSIRSHQTEDIYIGATTQTLFSRLASHKRDYRCYKKGKRNYVASFHILQYDDAYIELIENYPCNDRNELSKREGEVVRETDCINKRVPGRNKKEYYKDNKDKFVEYGKEYYKDNKDKILEYGKEYRDKNKDKILKLGREYYKDNKDKILKRGKEYRERCKEKIRKQRKEYREKNKDKIMKQEEENKDNKRRTGLRIFVKSVNGSYLTISFTINKKNNNNIPLLESRP